MNSHTTIDHQLIIEQVEHILKSPGFKKSKILSDFFRFIVAETLKGNEHSLKEYVIAINVLKKDSDFNPQLDAIVRIHGRRLRQLLNDYNDAVREKDEVKITIPKGRYIPIFELKGETRSFNPTVSEVIEQPSETIPLIAVMPFKNYENKKRVEVICSVLCQELNVGLSRFSEVGVISGYSTQMAIDSIKDKEKVISHLGADYLVTGSCILEAANLKVFFELHSVAKKQLLWAESYQIDDVENNKLTDFKTIIRKVLAVTCGFFGIIYRNALNANIPQDYDFLYAVYWHNKYHQNYSEAAFLEASAAIEIALQKNPDNAFLNSFKAQLLLDLCTMDIQDGTNYYDQGYALAQKAMRLDTKNQHALQVMAWAYLIGHNKEMTIQKMEECLAVNPNDSMRMTAMGFGYVCVGEYEKGIELMLESVRLNPYSFWLGNVGICFYFLHKGDYEEAIYWASSIQRPGLLWDHLLTISLNGLLNRKEDKSKAIEQLYTLSPNFDKRAPYIVNVFLMDKSLQGTILKGLEQAGLPIRQ